MLTPCEQLITGVITGDKHNVVKISGNFRKNLKGYSEAKEKLIREKKNLKLKTSCQTPFEGSTTHALSSTLVYEVT